ncbi:MAG: hypothetical protein BWY95_00103 [Bacteroidetes bacterium ADurb.BinA104]|jgi:hypothetical protein|nr:MAG: hypothetical protein BWY95_00103 [Bacteroidetes bacterium ADurb.BinA104]
MKTGTAERYQEYLNTVKQLPETATLRDARKLVSTIGVSCGITIGMEQLGYFKIVEGVNGQRYVSVLPNGDGFTIDHAKRLANHINKKKKKDEAEAVKALIDQTLVPKQLNMSDISQANEALSDEKFFSAVMHECKRRGYEAELTVKKIYR